MKSGLQVVKAKPQRLTRQQRMLLEITTLRDRAKAILVLADKLEAAVLQSPEAA
jgi:hypothetical protein